MSESYVTEVQQRAAYDALGLDPELYNRTASVLLEPWQTTVIRYALNDEGRKFCDPETNEPVTVITVLPLATKGTTDHA